LFDTANFKVNTTFGTFDDSNISFFEFDFSLRPGSSDSPGETGEFVDEFVEHVKKHLLYGV
jgi:hypothetical protein